MQQEIHVQESIFKKNKINAEELNQYLTGAGVFALNVMGAPGAGKTTALLRLCKLLDRPVAVIEGDIATDIDTVQLSEAGIRAVQINTGGECHLDTPCVAKAFERLMPVKGYVFIENIGNLVCPAEFMIGEHAKVLISSAAEGADKPYKYPLAFEKADLILLTKCDLAEAVGFDFAYYLAGVRQLNDHAPVVQVSVKDGGFEEAARWLCARASAVMQW